LAGASPGSLFNTDMPQVRLCHVSNHSYRSSHASHGEEDDVRHLQLAEFVSARVQVSLGMSTRTHAHMHDESVIQMQTRIHTYIGATHTNTNI